MTNKISLILEWYKDMGEDLLYHSSSVGIDRSGASKTNASAYSKLPDNRSENQLTHLRSMKVNSPENKVTPPSEAQDLAQSCVNLVELRKAVESFEGCALKRTAQSTVFADGNPQASIMLIGEAPGANEDRQGIPFCGQSGKLLDAILEASGLTRAEVYITNTVFWRPPDNRRPTLEELALCRPFVERHISLIQPELIILVGSTALEALLPGVGAITKMRQRYFDYSNSYLKSSIKTSVIFHPSYLLRQPKQKKIMWFDILKLRSDNPHLWAVVSE